MRKHSHRRIISTRRKNARSTSRSKFTKRNKTAEFNLVTEKHNIQQRYSSSSGSSGGGGGGGANRNDYEASTPVIATKKNRNIPSCSKSTETFVYAGHVHKPIGFSIETHELCASIHARHCRAQQRTQHTVGTRAGESESSSSSSGGDCPARNCGTAAVMLSGAIWQEHIHTGSARCTITNTTDSRFSIFRSTSRRHQQQQQQQRRRRRRRPRGGASSGVEIFGDSAVLYCGGGRAKVSIEHNNSADVLSSSPKTTKGSS